MNRRSVRYTLVITAFALSALLAPLNAAEPTPVSKSQAIQLLTSMGYEDVEVGAIVRGFAPMTGSDNVATVLGIGRRAGKVHKLEQVLFYDAEIGWFAYEYDGDGLRQIPPTKLRMWTLSGYKESKPKSVSPTADDDAKQSAVASTVQSIRSQLELYRLQHGDACPTAASLWDALTRETSYGGKMYGPYLASVPVNPFNQSSTVGTAATGTTNGWALVPTNGGYNFYGLGKDGTWIGN